MVNAKFKFCPQCTAELAWQEQAEDGGAKLRLRCTSGSCDFVHWGNPTPVLAAVVEVDGKILLAQNAMWTQHKFYALITGFMEAGETPYEGIAREVKEETNLDAQSVKLIDVYDFQRMNQVIIAFHVQGSGDVKLSPELVDYKLFDMANLKCWRSGTGFALADFLKSRGYEPEFFDVPKLRAD